MKRRKYTPESLLTSKGVADLLQVTPGTIHNWVNAGHLQTFRTPGGHLRIRVDQILAFLDDHELPVPSALLSINTRRLLVVDDDQKLLRALKRAMKPFADRIEVLCVDNGIQALLDVGTFQPNLILLDVVMPDVDGFQVCRRLKEKKETSGIEVILISGRVDKALRTKAKRAGATAVLQKPLDMDVLLEALGVVAA